MGRFVKQMETIAALVCLILVFQMSGCKAENSELENNRQLWRQRNIHNYKFTCERIQGGTFSWRPEAIEVREGKIISRKTVDGVPQYNSFDGYSEIETVEKIFELIRKRYEDGQKLEVKYNKEYGYPEEAHINILGNPDTEFTVQITNFEVVKTD